MRDVLPDLGRSAVDEPGVIERGVEAPLAAGRSWWVDVVFIVLTVFDLCA